MWAGERSRHATRDADHVRVRVVNWQIWVHARQPSREDAEAGRPSVHGPDVATGPVTRTVYTMSVVHKCSPPRRCQMSPPAPASVDGARECAVAQRARQDSATGPAHLEQYCPRNRAIA